MSLRVFHLFFILISITLAGFVGVWSFRTQPQATALGVASLGIGAGLIVYFFWFLRKSRKLHAR